MGFFFRLAGRKSAGVALIATLDAQRWRKARGPVEHGAGEIATRNQTANMVAEDWYVRGSAMLYMLYICQLRKRHGHRKDRLRQGMREYYLRNITSGHQATWPQAEAERRAKDA